MVQSRQNIFHYWLRAEQVWVSLSADAAGELRLHGRLGVITQNGAEHDA